MQEAAIWLLKLFQIAIGAIVIKTGYDYLQTDLLTSLFVMAIGIYFILARPAWKKL